MSHMSEIRRRIIRRARRADAGNGAVIVEGDGGGERERMAFLLQDAIGIETRRREILVLEEDEIVVVVVVVVVAVMDE